MQHGAKVHLAQNSSGRYNAGSCSKNAHVAELVDAHGSGPCAVRCGGSSPSVGTIYRTAVKEAPQALTSLRRFFVQILFFIRPGRLLARIEKLSLTETGSNGYDACLGASESPKRLFAHVAELVDAHGSGPCAVRCGGSSPSVGTTTQHAVKKKPHTVTSVRLFYWLTHGQRLEPSTAPPEPGLKQLRDLRIISTRGALLKEFHHVRQTRKNAAGVCLHARVRRIGGSTGILVSMAQQG